MTGTDLYPIKQDHYSGRLEMVYTTVMPKPGYHYEYKEDGTRYEVKDSNPSIPISTKNHHIVGGYAGTQYGRKEKYETDRKLTTLPIELPKILIPIPEIIKKIGMEEMCGTGIQSFEEHLELNTLGSGILRGSIIGIIVGIILMKVIK